VEEGEAVIQLRRKKKIEEVPEEEEQHMEELLDEEMLRDVLQEKDKDARRR